MTRTATARLVKRYPRDDAGKKRWIWQVRYPRTDEGGHGESIGYWTVNPRDTWIPRKYRGKYLERLSERQAQMKILELHQRIMKGEQDKPARTAWDDFAENAVWKLRGLKHSSIKEIRRALKAFGEFSNVDTPRAVNPDCVWLFVEKAIECGASHSTINKWLGCLRQVWYSEFPHTPNPFASKSSRNPQGIKRFPVVNKQWHWWTPDEISKLIDVCDNWWKAAIMCAYDCGMRAGEVWNLEWDNIDRRKKVLEVRPKITDEEHWAWSPKNRKPREVPLTPNVEMALNRIEPLDGVPYVFVPLQRYHRLMEDPSNTKKTKEVILNFLRQFHTRCRWAEIPEGDFHALRKTCVANWLSTGDLKTHEVQKFAGHASIETTIKFYSQIDDRAVTRARKSAVKLKAWQSAG